MREPRYYIDFIENFCFAAAKMAFISGPRQVGKTTLAKQLLHQRGAGHYYNWDETIFRRRWTKNPLAVVAPAIASVKPLIVLDEIHKAKLWKRSLKGIYDSINHSCDIIVTGSARLNIYRKGSDSLLGRYYHLRLHPFSLGELLRNTHFSGPEQLQNNLFTHRIRSSTKATKLLKQLLTFGPFPEPFLAASSRKLNLWQRNRIERLIREDLRDISRLPELSQVEMLVSLLPERVANPLSLTALSEDLEVAVNTIKRWLHYLHELYYHFEIKPYHRSLPRAIKKEGKLYLWDWSEVENPGARFENMIASHLLKYCHYLADTGYGDFSLSYLRNKEKKEIDFIILKNGRPWLPIEAKLNQDVPSENWPAFMKYLGCDTAVQVVGKENVFKIIKQESYNLLIISAEQFLQYLI